MHMTAVFMTLFIVANSEFHSQSLLRGWGGWFRKSFPVVVVGSSSWSQFLSGSGTAFCHIGLPASAANIYRYRRTARTLWTPTAVETRPVSSFNKAK